MSDKGRRLKPVGSDCIPMSSDLRVKQHSIYSNKRASLILDSSGSVQSSGGYHGDSHIDSGDTRDDKEDSDTKQPPPQ